MLSWIICFTLVANIGAILGAALLLLFPQGVILVRGPFLRSFPQEVDRLV